MKTYCDNIESINCSIALTNEDLLPWLYEHGYTNSNTFCPVDDYIFVSESKRIFSSTNKHAFDNLVKGQYDSLYGLYCADDIEMFKALTAFSNDTDKDQMFVLDTNVAQLGKSDDYLEKGYMVRCLRDKWNIDILDDGTPNPYSSRNVPAHKASIEEIINFYCK